MKKLIFVFFAGVSLMSCSKKEVSLPGAANQNVFFKNVDVEVENLKGSQTVDNSITVSFSTIYENNIQRIELMSSSNKNTFCTVNGVSIENNSQVVKTYSIQDANIKGKTMYYMLRFRDTDGNWTYSNYYTVNIK